MNEETEIKYPEHEKLQAVQHESQVQGELIEWLETQGYSICELSHLDNWHPIRLNTEKLLAKFHGINLTTLENEKRAMIEEMRTPQP